MRKIEWHTLFKKDYRRELKGKNRESLALNFLKIIQMLAEDIPLDKRHKDHSLNGNWNMYRDCHIRPDLVLIYKKTPGFLHLVRLGSHSELDL